MSLPGPCAGHRSGNGRLWCSLTSGELRDVRIRTRPAQNNRERCPGARPVGAGAFHDPPGRAPALRLAPGEHPPAFVQQQKATGRLGPGEIAKTVGQRIPGAPERTGEAAGGRHPIKECVLVTDAASIEDKGSPPGMLRRMRDIGRWEMGVPDIEPWLTAPRQQPGETTHSTTTITT
jgi:hypothetical protein